MNGCKTPLEKLKKSQFFKTYISDTLESLTLKGGRAIQDSNVSLRTESICLCQNITTDLTNIAYFLHCYLCRDVLLSDVFVCWLVGSFVR